MNRWKIKHQGAKGNFKKLLLFRYCVLVPILCFLIYSAHGCQINLLEIPLCVWHFPCSEILKSGLLSPAGARDRRLALKGRLALASARVQGSFSTAAAKAFFLLFFWASAHILASWFLHVGVVLKPWCVWEWLKRLIKSTGTTFILFFQVGYLFIPGPGCQVLVCFEGWL